jgi:hypothetical protein
MYEFYLKNYIKNTIKLKKNILFVQKKSYAA